MNPEQHKKRSYALDAIGRYLYSRGWRYNIHRACWLHADFPYGSSTQVDALVAQESADYKARIKATT